MSKLGPQASRTATPPPPVLITAGSWVTGRPCHRPITSFSECSATAAALQLPDDAIDDHQSDVPWDPPYCYFERFQLKFNNNGGNRGPCTPRDQCLCKCNIQTPIISLTSLADASFRARQRACGIPLISVLSVLCCFVVVFSGGGGELAEPVAAHTDPSSGAPLGISNQALQPILAATARAPPWLVGRPTCMGTAQVPAPHPHHHPRDRDPGATRLSGRPMNSWCSTRPVVTMATFSPTSAWRSWRRCGNFDLFFWTIPQVLFSASAPYCARRAMWSLAVVVCCGRKKKDGAFLIFTRFQRL